MGNTIASPPNLGYRVLKLTPDSPCSSKGLECFLDFITEISSLRREILLPRNSELYQFSKIILEIITPNRSIGLGLMLRQEDITISERGVFMLKGGIPEFKENEEFCLGLTRFSYRNIEEFLNYVRKGDIEKNEEMYVFNFRKSEGRYIRIEKGFLEGVLIEEGKIPVKEGSSCKSISKIHY